MDVKTFEKKLSMNTTALKQVKKLAQVTRAKYLEIGISTEFTITFTLKYGKNSWSSDELVVKIESWGPNKRIEIYGYINKRGQSIMALTPANINKIYSFRDGMTKLYTENHCSASEGDCIYHNQIGGSMMPWKR